MSLRRNRTLRRISIGLGALTLVSLAPLLLSDASPRLFSPAAHRVLASFPLVLIAVAYIAHEGRHRATPPMVAKAMILALAFLFWAANQLCPDHPLATLFNDVAIAGFVVDVFLVIVQWRGARGSSIGSTRSRRAAE